MTARDPHRLVQRAFAALVLVCGAGCVTTYEPIGPERSAYSTDGTGEVTQGYAQGLAIPVAIPFKTIGNGKNRLLNAFYSGILRRLQEAVEDGDVALLDSLVDSYDKPDLPREIKERLHGFRAVARGMHFQQHIQAHAQLQLVDAAGAPVAAAPPLTEPLRMTLTVPAMAEPVRLGANGDRDPVVFSVSVAIDDEFVDCGSRASKRDRYLPLPKVFELRGDDALVLPIEIAPVDDETVRRHVVVRVDLLPGYVQVGDVRAPVRRVTVGAATWTLWPRGYEILAKQPLLGLQRALAQFEPRHFASAYVASLLVPEDQRDQACALLIDQVRYGSVDQAKVAMAALQHVADVDLAVGDRDGWLAWWQGRRARGR